MRILEILNNENWIKDYDFYDKFMASSYLDKLREAYEKLNTDILFTSHIHGKDHIERVIFFSVLLSFAYKLDEADTNILINAASLHDTRRVNDGWDTEHGPRAARESIQYAHDIKKEDKEILQAVIAAHSRDDKNMDETIREFVKNEDDFPRAKRLAKFFKDADGLDRVRINLLDPAYLRNDYSKNLVDFSYKLFEKF
ncbi:hypothetical protein [Anaerococcus tetradius]|uniref:HD domain-containing protein n=1 Tax=Anaerococcus tetradius ATCC 35098 TaxID=525255 RepID=C2CIL9_9FIRM|nr:hypothetical protein [Anaerococcus tetradius]EEI82615.1 hypothetical protein HMPREF0077_1368 [Anaerococcus tetradius ATCC 35098]